MAAITYTLFNVAEGGGRILTTTQVYGGTFDSFKKIYPNFNIYIDQVSELNNLDEWESSVKPDTKAIFIETISNPNASIADLVLFRLELSIGYRSFRRFLKQYFPL